MTTDSDVLSYLNDLQSPQREIVAAIRALILQVDEDIDEAIRWGTLTFQPLRQSMFNQAD